MKLIANEQYFAEGTPEECAAFMNMLTKLEANKVNDASINIVQSARGILDELKNDLERRKRELGSKESR